MSRKKIIAVLVVCLAIAIGLYFYIQISEAQSKHFQITFFNVGQGDSALINFADGKKMLVDCGIDRTILQKLGEALPFYDRKIDYLLVSHPDADHYGGCPEVLKRYEVGTILTNGDNKTDDPYWPAWEKYSKSAKEYRVIKAPSEEDIAGTHFEFFNPDSSLPLGAKYKSGNNLSTVFRLSVGNKKYLFTGDMESPVELSLLSTYCSSTPVNCPVLKSDYLKIGHHGSDTSSDEKFLEAVSPQVAIISVGKNSYGHPSFRVLKKLERIGAEIWRTDEKNDIIIE